MDNVELMVADVKRTSVRHVKSQSSAFLYANTSATLRPMTESFHDRIRKRLNAMGKTPQTASKEAGLSKDYLRTLMGRESVPNGENLKRLARVLSTTSDWLLTGIGDEIADDGDVDVLHNALVQELTPEKLYQLALSNVQFWLKQTGQSVSIETRNRMILTETRSLLEQYQTKTPEEDKVSARARK